MTTCRLSVFDWLLTRFQEWMKTCDSFLTQRNNSLKSHATFATSSASLQMALLFFCRKSRLKCISSTGLKAGQSCFISQCLKFTQKVSFYPFYNIARSTFTTFTLIFASKNDLFSARKWDIFIVSKHYGTTLGRKLTIFIEKFVSQTFWVTFEMKSKQANTVSKKRDVGRRWMKWGIELLFPPAGRSSLNSLFEMRWWQKLRRKLKLHWQKRQSIIGLFCSRNLAKETINLLQILEMHLLRLYLRIARRGYHCCCGKQNINLPLPKLCLHCLLFIDSNLTFRLELF